MSHQSAPVILFDGICNLCNAAVNWIIDRDSKSQFRFASLQSEAALQLLGSQPNIPDSIVLIDEQGIHTRSAAALRIAKRLGFPYNLTLLATPLPAFFRDAIYNWIARNRYSWFGHQDSCRVPTPDLADRFLDAGETIAIPPVPASSSSVPGWFTRFLWIYILLFAAPIPTTIGRKFYPWLAAKLFNIQITAFPSGSGDTTYNYVELGVEILLALTIASLWRWRLPHWFPAAMHLFLRYFLALAIMGYGWHKLIPRQFPYPGPATLLNTYVDSSPMALVWIMVGASMPYQMLMGAIEVAVGLLLMFPSTVLVGAIANAAVFIQIMALNYCYDIPVKLKSTHLFLFSCVLIFPHLPRILSFFVLRIPTVPPPVTRLQLPGKWWPRLALLLKCYILFGVMIGNPVEGYRSWRADRDAIAASPLHGLYIVDPDETKPPPARWVRVGITGERMMTVLASNGGMQTNWLRHNPTARTIEIQYGRKDAERSIFKYSKPSPQTLLLERGSFKVLMRKDPRGEGLLLSRGFHWINEVPFNR